MYCSLSIQICRDECNAIVSELEDFQADRTQYKIKFLISLNGRLYHATLNIICTCRINLQRKHKSSYSRQSVVLQRRTNEKDLYSIKTPYGEIILFTTLSCISDPAGY